LGAAPIKRELLPRVRCVVVHSVSVGSAHTPRVRPQLPPARTTLPALRSPAIPPRPYPSPPPTQNRQNEAIKHVR